MVFAIPYMVFHGFSIFQSIASNTLPELQHNSQTAPKCLQDTPKILPRASQDPFLEASWAPTSLSWRALGRSWALLGALGTLLGQTWALLARFEDLQGSILVSPELLQEVAEQPKRRTFRKSAESCPRTVREDCENQIQQRWIASSLHRSPRG